VLVLLEKHERERPLGRPRLRWEDSIKIHLQEVEWGRGLNLSGTREEKVELVWTQ
jgi:hypothetical protein